jgi:hypothetical protein
LLARGAGALALAADSLSAASASAARLASAWLSALCPWKTVPAALPSWRAVAICDAVVP